MLNSFIRVAAACPITNVADVAFNVKNIKECITDAVAKQSKLVVFPELCTTSYTCGDLFLQNQLLDASNEAIHELCEYSKGKDILISVGAPLLHNSILYNCAFVIFEGKVLGIIPKSYIPNYSEFYEKRWFSEGVNIIDKTISMAFQQDIPFGVNLIFQCGKFKFGFEICEDLWVTIPPSSHLSLLGANIIGNLSASNELVGKADTRYNLVKNQSEKAVCSYIYTSSGVFESSTDLLFSGHMMIAENGSISCENDRFKRENEVITSLIDIDKIESKRVKNVSYRDSSRLCPFDATFINFSFKSYEYGEFDKFIDKHPFIPTNDSEITATCEEIFKIQTHALAKRMTHTRIDKAVVGISGGLDSTLALLVIVKTFDLLNIPRKNIITITMPGFGTTDRTYTNAVKMCKDLGCDFREINIVDASLQHFKDIGHPAEVHDVTYENVQARERTQILMDLANKEGGLLIGTGDLSELALGWCTYNGDHMSMYSVNCSIPKTLVKFLVTYVAKYELKNSSVSETLMSVVDTPVSPELLPKDKDDNIVQKTEDIVGPYELHDFFLYHFMKEGATKEKLQFLTEKAFEGDYSAEEISKWLDKFLYRFFSQQFKRSALPDGPKVGSISLSPRGDLRMPSDASFNTWM